MKQLSFYILLLFQISVFQSAFSQNRAFLNGDFENPPISTGLSFESLRSTDAPLDTPGNRVTEWHTTAPDYKIEYRWNMYPGGEPSAVGKQHVEINAVYDGKRLYQNVCLIKGETIGYSYYHRGRKGIDGMDVNLYDEYGTVKVATLKYSATDRTAWRLYSDVYNVTVPSGVYQFSFESVSITGVRKSEGNLLDDVQVKMAPVVTLSKANYQAVENDLDVPYIKVNGTVPAGGMDIALSTASSSATAGTDFTMNTAMHIPEGSYTTVSDSFPVQLMVLNDQVEELDETIKIAILSVSNTGVSDAACGGAVAANYIIRNDDVFEAGPDQVVCARDSATVNASGGESPSWNMGVKQGVRFRVPDIAGDYYYVTRDTSYTALGTFKALKDSLKITVNTTPLPITADVTTCQQSGNQTLTGVGTNLIWYSDTSSKTGIPTPVIDLNSPDTTVFWLSQTLNSCESEKAKLTVRVKALPAAPVANDYQLCEQPGFLTLSAAGSNSKWYNVASGGSSSAVAPVVDKSNPDTVSYWVSQTVNSCEGSRTEIEIRVTRLPSAPLIRDTVMCQQTGMHSLTANGENLKWYTSATTGLGSSIAPAINLNVPDTLRTWVSQTVQNCEGPRAAIQTMIKPLPVAPASRDTIFCQQPGNLTLTATGASLSWYNSALGGTRLGAAPMLNTNVPDTVTHYVSQTTNGCEGPRAALTVRIKATPAAPVVKDSSLCQQTGSLTLTAQGTQLSWYFTASGSSGFASAPVINLSVPTTHFKWVSQTVDACESPRASMIVLVKPLPAAPLGKDTFDCQKPGNAFFKATGTDLKWYAGGSSVGTTSVPVISTNFPGTTTYAVSQTVDGCEGPKVTLSIEVRPTPAAPSVSNQEVCQVPGTISFSATGTSLKWYNSSLVYLSASAPSQDTDIPGTYKALVSQTMNACESPKQEVFIRINATPSSPVVSAVSYCLNDPAKPITITADSLSWYTVSSGGTKSFVVPVPDTRVAGVMRYWVSQVKKGCEGPRAEMAVTINTLPNIKITGTNSGTYCEKSTIAFKGTGAMQYIWTVPSGAMYQQPGLTLTNLSVKDQGVYILKGVDGNQCSAKDSVTIGVKTAPSVTATPVSVCEKAPISVQAITTGSAYWKLSGKTVQNSATLFIPRSAYSDNGRYVVISTQNGCTDSLEVQISVTNCPPAAGDDEYSIYSDEKLTLQNEKSLLDNDSDPNDKLLEADITFLTSPSYGEITPTSSGSYIYTPHNEVEGIEMLEYQVCDRGIPSLCTRAKVRIEIKKRDAFLPDAFTPNGDGINDTYIIHHVSSRISVGLEVFNRWGDIVYRSNDYKNNWNGTCTENLCLGQELPVGTYYVVAKLSNGNNYTTHLTLSR